MEYFVDIIPYILTGLVTAVVTFIGAVAYVMRTGATSLDDYRKATQENFAAQAKELKDSREQLRITLETELNEEKTARKELEGRVREVEATLNQLIGEKKVLVAENEQLAADLAQANIRIGSLENQVRTLQELLNKERIDKDAIKKELDRATTELDDMRAQKVALETKLNKALSESTEDKSPSPTPHASESSSG